MDIKIVGLLSGEDDITEMEHIAKVFVVERRMQQLPYDRKTTNTVLVKKYIKAPKHHAPSQINTTSLPLLNIRGMN
ncbi:MAG: hypothetical protein NT038_02150 [Euryarchaeota archaeon]|nr:hypothetical protein [Euryarchaeota archaeon]